MTAWLLVAAVSGVAVAVLITADQAPVALALLAVVPAFVLFTRYPLAAIFLWILFTQFIVEGEGGIERRVYWVIHRAMPMAVVIMMVVAAATGIRKRPLRRLGAADFLALGYIAVSFISIVYLSPTPQPTSYHLFDRVVAPVGLYLLIRLSGVRERDLRRLIPILAVVVIVQSMIGVLSWVAPGVLPGAWLGRLGTRTIGSLGHPNVYGVTMLSAGALLFHAAMTLPMSRLRRSTAIGLFLLSLVMTFMTFGRANWLAGVVVVGGLFLLYPRQLARLGLVVVPVLGLVLASGVFATQIETASDRFLSEQSAESALSRLPVVYASLAMFEAKPITGWGYGNFDLYDRQFQATIEGLFVPEKDHASHNLYLTILAEQGSVGFLLYLGPAALIAATALRRRRGLPRSGFVSQRLMAVLGVCLAAHLTVNNFANMRIVFGLGLWWVTLALLAAVSDLAAPEEESAVVPGPQIAKIPLHGLAQRVDQR